MSWQGALNDLRARPAGASAIAINEVHHHYGAVVALEDVSLSLPAGTTIGLIGPDGVGKSTLLDLSPE